MRFALALVLATGCFNPRYNNPTCGPAGECPEGMSCVDGTCRGAGVNDGSVDDSLSDGADDAFVQVDASNCLGSGAYQLCPAVQPSGTVTISSGTFNTDTSPQCATNIPWTDSQQPAACVVAGMTISVPSTVSVVGSKPLVLFATGSIAISTSGTLDVASHRTGPVVGAAAQPSACAPFPGGPVASTGGGGGGAGGSFMTKGGGGGAGGNAAAGGLSPAADASAPTVLRGGCGGQTGAASLAAPGVGGPGGGAVYLVAGTSIAVNGAINASGAGGATGEAAAGAGGGGAGGMIVLHSPAITSSNGRLVANGGGGGGGGGSGSGQAGSDPSPGVPLTPAQGGTGGAGNGCGGSGRGGNGFAGSMPAADAEPGSTMDICGGGGGGGGGGYIRANVAITGVTASPALVVVP